MWDRFDLQLVKQQDQLVAGLVSNNKSNFAKIANVIASMDDSLLFARRKVRSVSLDVFEDVHFLHVYFGTRQKNKFFGGKKSFLHFRFQILHFFFSKPRLQCRPSQLSGKKVT
jgi:hypothetical protein